MPLIVVTSSLSLMPKIHASLTGWDIFRLVAIRLKSIFSIVLQSASGDIRKYGLKKQQANPDRVGLL